MTRLNTLDVIAQQFPDGVVGTRAGQFEPSKMGDVEETDRVTHGAMLGENRLVLNRHFPTTEIDKTRSERSVGLV